MDRSLCSNSFAGGSTGGREALECATTYGKYYDGIFCCEPASNYVLIRMWGRDSFAGGL